MCAHSTNCARHDVRDTDKDKRCLLTLYMNTKMSKKNQAVDQVLNIRTYDETGDIYTPKFKSTKKKMRHITGS